MIINHIPALGIQEDDELRLLRACWQRNRHSPIFREVAGRLVDRTQQQGIQLLLLELNDMPDVLVYDQLWLSTTLLPQLARLCVQRLVIILAEQRVYNRHVLESLLMQLHNQIRCDIQFFTQSEPALDWLTDNSPRVPALLAEWRQEYQATSSTTAPTSG